MLHLSNQCKKMASAQNKKITIYIHMSNLKAFAKTFCEVHVQVCLTTLSMVIASQCPTFARVADILITIITGWNQNELRKWQPIGRSETVSPSTTHQARAGKSPTKICTSHSKWTFANASSAICFTIVLSMMISCAQTLDFWRSFISSIMLTRYGIVCLKHAAPSRQAVSCGCELAFVMSFLLQTYRTTENSGSIEK